MTGIMHTVARVFRKRIITATLVAVGAAAAFTQIAGQANHIPADPLPYAHGYLITGNYVASGVDLTEELNPPDGNGISTGTIHIVECDPDNNVVFNCVPEDADIVAAYMFWEMILPEANPALATGVTFRGEPILLNDVKAVKSSTEPLIGSTSSCWSSGSPLMMVQFRADVLRFLPFRLDADDKPTGKRLVTDDDLDDHELDLHSVTLPTRNGNQIPESAGASLVLVYRDLNEPLRKIVMYDGIHIQDSLNEETSLTIRGFYQSAPKPTPATTNWAKITHLVGSGQPNNNEVVSFTGGATTTNISPFNPIVGGASSERAWSTLTYDVSDYMVPVTASGLTNFGEIVTTTVKHAPPNGGFDCLSLGAVIFSTPVKDADQDGLPDGLEDSTTGLLDPPTLQFPDGQPLPVLNAMGTGQYRPGSDKRDVFVEINAMRTTFSKFHGSADAPYPGVTTPPFRKSVPAHTHIPTPDVLAMIGDAYDAQNIRVHFDVGDIDDYKSLPSVQHPDWVDDYNSEVADNYLIPSLLARGGEVVDERACSQDNPNCPFPDYPGVVSWKAGLQLYRDAPVDDDTGAEFAPGQQGKIVVPSSWDGRRRFDRNRRGLFHYVLYAHYRGKRASEKPCLDTSPDPDLPIDFPTGQTTCTGAGITDNLDFYRPTSGSGVADLPGGNVMVTLGFWDDFVGRPFVQASTTFHELGHNYNLWHGGWPAIWGDKAKDTSSYIEPNCKPNYLSSMSYLFQVHGLFNNDDEINLGFSGTSQRSLSESPSETDAQLPGSSFRTAWYAPFGSELAMKLGLPEAKRYCHGEAFSGTPKPSVARVYTLSTLDVIDWNGDGNDLGDSLQADPNQDINFDHATNATLLGHDDWGSVRLDQISAGRNAVKFQDGDFLEFGSGDFLEFGSGDFLEFGSGEFLGDFLEFGSGEVTGDFLEFGSGDFIEFGSGAILETGGDFLEFGSGDFLEFGSGDFLEFGSGDFLEFGSGTERQELTFELAKDLGRGTPYNMKGCVVTDQTQTDCVTAQAGTPLYHRPRLNWKPPAFGAVSLYEVSRKWEGGGPSADFVAPVPTSTTATTIFIDQQELPEGQFFTYRSRAKFTDNVLSGYISKTVTLEAKNDLPTPQPDPSYTIGKNKTLTVPTSQGVRANDTDPDSPQTAIQVMVATQPANGTLTLATDGSFTYRPKNGFVGVDTFTYTATNGNWTTTVPMNTGTPAPVLVTITVTAK